MAHNIVKTVTISNFCNLCNIIARDRFITTRSSAKRKGGTNDITRKERDGKKKEKFLWQSAVSRTGKFLIAALVRPHPGENPFEHFRARIYLIISDDGGRRPASVEWRIIPAKLSRSNCAPRATAPVESITLLSY